MKKHHLPILGLLLAMSSLTASAQGLKDAYKGYFTIGVALNQRNVSDESQKALVKLLKMIR